MTRFKLFILTVVAALSVAACDTGDYGSDFQRPDNLMTFEFVGDEPVIAAPDEEVFYSLKVSYSKGLASMSVSLDGEVIEGSEKTWDDAPLEAEYSFNYIVKGSQFGQTLDFVFTATGVFLLFSAIFISFLSYLSDFFDFPPANKMRTSARNLKTIKRTQYKPHQMRVYNL